MKSPPSTTLPQPHYGIEGTTQSYTPHLFYATQETTSLLQPFTPPNPIHPSEASCADLRQQTPVIAPL
jgi:hypothetical protein